MKYLLLFLVYFLSITINAQNSAFIGKWIVKEVKIDFPNLSKEIIKSSIDYTKKNKYEFLSNGKLIVYDSYFVNGINAKWKVEKNLLYMEIPYIEGNSKEWYKYEILDTLNIKLFQTKEINGSGYFEMILSKKTSKKRNNTKIFISDFFHYQFEYSKDFNLIFDKSKIHRTIERMSNKPIDNNLYYEALINLKQNPQIDYPFFVIYSSKNNIPKSIEEVKKDIYNDDYILYEKGSILLKDKYFDKEKKITHNKPLIDEENSIITFQTHTSIENKEVVETVLTIFLGRKSMTFIGFYYLASDFKNSMKYYREIINSYKFEEGYNYK